MNIKNIINLISLSIVSISITTTADATLISRLDGLAYYHQELDITWLGDANFARTSGFDSNGQLTWDEATDWVTDLTISGIDGWRLASHDVNGDGVIVDCSTGGVLDCNDNEMGYLFYEEGVNRLLPAPFINVQNEDYWSSTEYIPSSQIDSWVFHFGEGSQNPNFNTSVNYAWAVFDGDIGNAIPINVPESASVFLLLIGLLGFVIVQRCREN